jgi:hypothetical protein
MTEVPSLIRRIEPERAGGVHWRHAAHFLDSAGELGCDLIMRGRTDAQG